MVEHAGSFITFIIITITGLNIGVRSMENQTETGISCIYGHKIIYGATPDDNGSLMTHDGDKYPTGTWEKQDDKFYVCKCTVRPCIRKCCPEGQEILNSYNMTCEDVPEEMPSSLELLPTIYKEAGLIPVIHGNEREKFEKHFDTIYGVPCSDDEVQSIPEVNETQFYYFLEDGNLAGFSGIYMYNIMQYCYLAIIEENDLVPVMCEIKEEKPHIRFLIYSIGMIISIPCLVATFLVFAFIKQLSNVHCRCVMSYLLLLILGYISLPIVALHIDHLSNVSCISLAFIIYFAFLASFFWLNVMCLDIWWTFSGFRPMRGSVKEREHKKFIIYSLYCWGSPLIMLIIALIMDLHPGIPETYEKPGFGEKKCWFRSNMGNFIYFSGPIAILIVCNIVLFILTAFKIRQVKRGTKILKKQDSRRHNEEEENNAQRFNLYLKLFLVMGVNWIMEVISFAAGGPDEWWYVTDLANTLQGVLIFVIFVWKDRIRRLLMERFCPGRVANMNSTVNSSSTRMTGIRRNGSVMSSNRSSLKTQEGHQMKALAASHSVRSDDSDVA